MTNLILLLLPILLSLPSPSSSSSSTNSTTINWWCDRTPHPKACRHYLPSHSPPKHRTDFYKLSLHAAFRLTLRAHSRLSRLGPRCRHHPHQRTAWSDCLHLYNNTLLQLNRTLSSSCSSLDSQTWLSAALTNLRTCRKGFSDLRQSYRLIQPIMNYNISDLVSNCLSINRPNNQSFSPTTTSNGSRRHLLQLSAATANIVVAKDGSGNVNNIGAAIATAAAQRRKGGMGRIVIYVKAGVYNEIVTIDSSLSEITMLGDGMGKTVITGSRSVALGFTTFSSPTFSVFGDGFIASGVTFRNTYGPGTQAVALLSGSDQSVFYRCSFEGYQDTLCVYSQRQFYRECDIYGTIDFIFGNAASVIQNCNIIVRRPLKGEANVITAQGRTDPNQNTGIVIQFSTIKPAPELVPVRRMVKSFLGRPWQLYSRTLYLQNYMDSIIDPAGWFPYSGDFALSTLFYGEYRNSGPGSRILRFRVTWKGFRVFGRPSQVRKFTVGNFIAGDSWIPRAGVPFYSGL